MPIHHGAGMPAVQARSSSSAYKGWLISTIHGYPTPIDCFKLVQSQNQRLHATIKTIQFKWFKAPTRSGDRYA